MKKFIKILSTGILALSVFAFAQSMIPFAHAEDTPCEKLKQQITAGGFDISQLPEYCTTESVYVKFLNTAMYAVGIAAVGAIIYGGFLYMTAQSNEAQRKQGRSILTWAIVGLTVVIVAVLLVNVVINLIVENKFV